MDTKGITLYRGITPGAIPWDVHGGHGEAWSRSFAFAKRYARFPGGYVLEALLHSSAKQLILTNVEDEDGFTDYVEDGLKLLAELVDYSWLYTNLMSGFTSLWETWDPEWTEKVIQAGYDTIFTQGFEGAEEYVLNPSVLRFTRYHRVLTDKTTKAHPIEPDTLEQLGYVVRVGMVINPQ